MWHVYMYSMSGIYIYGMCIYMTCVFMWLVYIYMCTYIWYKGSSMLWDYWQRGGKAVFLSQL